MLGEKARRIATEAALVGGLFCQGRSMKLCVLSDGARQFNVFEHALCWVHAERALTQLNPILALDGQGLKWVRHEFWSSYRELGTYREAPSQAGREQVTRRKVSGGTRSEAGRRCRDTFLSLKKTCRKHGVSFWAFLKDRITQADEIPSLADLIPSSTARRWVPGVTRYLSAG